MNHVKTAAVTNPTAVALDDLKGDALRTFWEGHVSAYKESGLKKTVYAKQHGLPLHRFKYWSLKQRPSKQSQQRHPQKQASFIPLKVEDTAGPLLGPSPAPLPVALCEVTFPQGMQWRIHDMSALQLCLTTWRA